jgi:hypothetical protein
MYKNLTRKNSDRVAQQLVFLLVRFRLNDLINSDYEESTAITKTVESKSLGKINNINDVYIWVDPDNIFPQNRSIHFVNIMKVGTTARRVFKLELAT